MGDDDGDPHNRRGCHFPVGSLIEVQDNVEEGVYFSATVVPSPASRRRSSSRNSEKLRVKYHDLLASEDRPDRLTESVDVSYVRPAPPSVADKRFEPNDVVDAFYKDGWWKGVVSRVVEGGERFEVTFENPPDLREFGPESLRAHWDWVDGVWIGPQKQSEVVFEVGEKVEASLERDEDFIGAWIPATIVEISGNGAYFVELKDKNGGWVRAEVDFSHLRPSPPIFQQRNFGTSERVEAFFNSGWWSGFITKKVLKNRYGVFLERMKLNKVFTRSELRARMDWKGGKWCVGSALASISETTSPSTKRRKFEKKKKIEKIVVEDEDPVMGEENVSVQVDEQQAEDLQKEVSEPLIDEGRNEDANQKTEHMAIEKFVVQDEDPIMGVEIDGSSLMPQSLVSSAAIEEGDVLPDSAATKRRKVGLDNHRTSRKRRKITQKKIEKIVVQDEDPMMGEENVSVQVDEGRNEDANQETTHMAIEKFVVQDEDSTMGVDNALVQADEEQIHGSSLVPQSLASSSVIEEEHVLPDSGWPFAKRNVAWKAIESMEVFRRMPQKPHFQPLRDFKETAREGMAIGYMVTFSNVVERSCSLNIKDPKCDIEGINEELLELEAHGFDVGMVRNRLMKLLGAKDKEEKLEHELRDIKNQIEDHRHTKSKIEKEITVIQNHLRRLREHLGRLQIDKANELRQLAQLKAELHQNQQQIDILRSGFEAGG